MQTHVTITATGDSLDSIDPALEQRLQEVNPLLDAAAAFQQTHVGELQALLGAIQQYSNAGRFSLSGITLYFDSTLVELRRRGFSVELQVAPNYFTIGWLPQAPFDEPSR